MKKKAAIITRHAIANYGSVLQSYATEKLFENAGYEAVTINYIPEDEKIDNLINTYIKNSSFWNKNFISRFIYKVIQKKNIENMEKKFLEYREDLLKQTKREYNSIEELERDCPDADVFCTGSDQVWGKIGSKKFDTAYFLEFVKDKNKCISYASSFGKTDIDKELEEKMPVLLEKYSSLLVRENSAVEVLKKHGFINCNQVLDPTLLIEKNEWNEICSNISEKEKYVLVYQLHHNKKFERYVKEFSKKTDLKLIRINPSIYFKFKPGNFIYLPTPGEFLSYIKNANFILTDSFHGTVFSLIFNKNFANFLPSHTSTRITSLLQLVGLEERIIKDTNDFSLINKEINYEKVNNILQKERKKSLNLFHDSL